MRFAATPEGDVRHSAVVGYLAEQGVCDFSSLSPKFDVLWSPIDEESVRSECKVVPDLWQHMLQLFGFLGSLSFWLIPAPSESF